MLLRDVIIVGAGPAGLAAAITASRVGLDYLVLEKGVLVNSIYHFPPAMVFFTTPELLELGDLPFVTPHEKPTRDEALRYYRKVVDRLGIGVTFDHEVRAIEPEADERESRFAVETRSGRGIRRVSHARFVVLATGCYDHPNLLGIPGEDLPHVSHYYTGPHPFFRKPVVVVGGKNSAAEASLDLYRNGAHVTLVHRRDRLGESIKYWVKPDIENRIKAGAIAARFETGVVEIRPTSVVVERHGEQDELPADGVFLLTGYHADVELLARAGVRVDPGTCVPAHHPETFETNVPGLFLAGEIAAGRQSGRIFIENGRFHGETVIREITARLARGRSHGATE